MTVQVPTAAAQDLSDADSTADVDQVTGPGLSHLPPLYLWLLFPADHPSASMPAAQLSALWLPPESAQVLLDRMADLWDEQVCTYAN